MWAPPWCGVSAHPSAPVRRGARRRHVHFGQNRSRRVRIWASRRHRHHVTQRSLISRSPGSSPARSAQKDQLRADVWGPKVGLGRADPKTQTFVLIRVPRGRFLPNVGRLPLSGARTHSWGTDRNGLQDLPSKIPTPGHTPTSFWLKNAFQPIDRMWRTNSCRRAEPSADWM